MRTGYGHKIIHKRVEFEYGMKVWVGGKNASVYCSSGGRPEFRFTRVGRENEARGLMITGVRGDQGLS